MTTSNGVSSSMPAVRRPLNSMPTQGRCSNRRTIVHEAMQDSRRIHYMKEAIALVDAGKDIKAKRSNTVEVPDDLTKAMRRYKGATAAFRRLTPGKQREYAEHIASAKRDATKQRRIEKVLPMIAAGAGLHDKYRNC
ncbi:MAG: hypothetical protein EX272_02540 [Chromatiales bacterium]|nr:MAG: hypothetical protein EX272_02540 [Chromatiales bacterium]